MIRIALAGNPNSGKTTLFNALTGSTAHVGNWPGVTVDKREGTYKKGSEPVKITDLPGIYSLSPYTPEEVVSRNFVLDERPDCIINIVDATNLERNLYLTTQLLEIDVPVVIALNMMDQVEKSGIKIDAATLEAKIGVPVVSISALKGTNISELMKRAISTSKQPRKATTVLAKSSIKHLINDVTIALDAIKVENSLFHAIKLIEGDELEVAAHEDLVVMVESFKATMQDECFGSDLEAIIADGRYRYITGNYASAMVKPKEAVDFVTKSDKIDKVLTNRWLGIPIFLAILFGIFHITFSGNILFMGIEGLSFEGTAFEGMFLTGDGIASLGVILQTFMGGITGIIGGWLETLFASSPAWISGILVSGAWEGIGAVLSFVPQILVLLLFFSILEDSGYMARIAFILDRIFRRFGISGKAFMPMVMGFGCSIPAIINTRNLADEKEKLVTIRVIPFFSCGAKMPILLAIAGAIVHMMGSGNVDLIVYSMYVFGISLAMISIIVMRKTTLKGDAVPFIMELPSYRVPQFKNLMIHLWDKFQHYIKKAFTIIFASTIIVWVLSHASFDWRLLTDEQMNESILAGLGQMITPLFTPLGFGSQLSAYSWVFVVAAVTGLIAKENVIATFAVLAAVVGGIIPEGLEDGVGEVIAMITATGITTPALISFIVFNMTTIPCFAAVATTKAELSKSKYRSTLAFWLIVSYLVSSAVYLVGTWWWTVFIVVAVAIAMLLLYKVYDARKTAKGKLV